MPYFLRKISIEQFPHKEVNHPLESFNQKWNFALTDVAQLFGHRSAKRNVAGPIPSQGICLGCVVSPL